MLLSLPYHQKIVGYFKAQPKTWEFFSNRKTKDEQLAEYKTELLKNTYKFDPATDEALFKKIEEAKEKLQLGSLVVHAYQAQYTGEINASVILIENETHMVFSGSITQSLSEEELLTVIAHELSHIKLLLMNGGEVEVASRIVSAINNNHNSESAHLETARLFQLYTEIFCDRGAYTVVGTTAPVITSLVKIATGLPQVSAESYLKQADEIFASESGLKTKGISHPENFIRAKAIQLWHEKKEHAEEEIAKLIEGTVDLDTLDIFQQREIEKFTREFLQLYLKPKWYRTTLVASQAKQFFTDFNWKDSVLLEEGFIERVEKSHQSMKDYLCYLLLDFALLDPNLEEVPMGWSFQFAEDVQLKDSFDAIVRKEMKFSDKKLQQYKEKALSIFSAVKEGEGEQIYE